MRLKIDENLPVDVAVLLRQAGHDPSTVLEQGLGGQPDQDVARVCAAEGRALLTLDTDFANTRRYPPSDYQGLIVMRLARQDKPYVIEVVRRLIALLEREPVEGRLWIVEERRVRVRE
jgi:predicted nuclease of predicted toxin-antitoxin system